MLINRVRGACIAVQWILDECCYFRRWLLHVFIWALLRVRAIEVTFAEVKNQRILGRVPLNIPDTSRARAPATVLEMALRAVAAAEARYSGVVDKAKTMLTFLSLVLAFVGLVLSRTGIPDTREGIVILLAVLVCVTVSTIALLGFFGPGQKMSVSLTSNQMSEEGEQLQRVLAKDYLNCAADLDHHTDYLVEVLRAARGTVLAGFFAACALVLLLLDADRDALARTEQNSSLDSGAGRRGIHDSQCDNHVADRAFFRRTPHQRRDLQ